MCPRSRRPRNLAGNPAPHQLPGDSSHMADDDIQYQFTETKTVRGTEKRAIAKKQQEGWELLSQEPGRLQTTLQFRRPKPKRNWLLWAGLGGVAVVTVGVIAVDAIAESGDTAPSAEPVATSTADRQTSEPAPSPATDSTVPAPVEVLTIDNNEDLARLLFVGNTCGQEVADFATKYKGQTIQFDGHVGAIGPHDTYNTRFDILISPRDFDENDGRGPSFQFQDVNYYDLGLTGPNDPDSVGLLDKLQVTAVVEEFDPNYGCLLFLEPVSTESR